MSSPGSQIAIVQGIVEGLTEFLPVSSTGHLIISGHLLGFTGELANTFEIFIQLGAILAVVVLYWNRFLDLIPKTAPTRGLLVGGFKGWAGIAKLCFGCLPAFVLGFLFHDFIKENLFSPKTVAYALIVGGLAMILVERMRFKTRVSTLEELTLRQSFLVGIFQCFALWPGMSRSASTIVGGLLVGANRIVAAEYSFLLAVPVMCAAVGYDLLKSASQISQGQIGFFVIGFFVSFFSALLAIRFFLSLLRRYTLQAFGFYRIILGISVLYIL